MSNRSTIDISTIDISTIDIRHYWHQHYRHQTLLTSALLTSDTIDISTIDIRHGKIYEKQIDVQNINICRFGFPFDIKEPQQGRIQESSLGGVNWIKCRAKQGKKILWGETCGVHFFLTNLGRRTPDTQVLGSAPAQNQ